MARGRSHPRTVHEAIRRAERVLPGVRAPEGEEDPRWQAIIVVGEFIESDPEAVWEFAARWGKHANEDLRTAIAVLLVEHLLEHHFRTFFPRLEALSRTSVRFGDCFKMCWKLGQARHPANRKRFHALEDELSGLPRGWNERLDRQLKAGSRRKRRR